jgi:integrase
MNKQQNASENNLKMLFEEYLKECQFTSGLRPATIKGYASLFLLFTQLMPDVGSVQFLTPPVMTEFFRQLQERTRIVGKDTPKMGVKASTIKTYWTKLNVFFQWLHRKGYIPNNPLKELKRPPEPRYDDSKALKDEDVDKMLSTIVLRNSSPLILRRDIAILSVLYYCGLRRGELISLRVCDIDIGNAKITIAGETSKSKRARTLPMHPSLAKNLKDYFTERNKMKFKTEMLWVSANKGDAGLTRNGLKHWEKRLMHISGVKFHAHQFRHSFATNLAKQDVGIVKIQKLLGHRSITMTERYVRSMGSEDLQDDINKL